MAIMIGKLIQHYKLLWNKETAIWLGLSCLIHIGNDSQHKKSAQAMQQYWLYDEGAFAEVDLDLVDVNPPSCWDQERAMIVSRLASSDGALARFRHSEEGCPDFVMLLEFRQQGTSAEPRCHVTICGRDTSLQELAEKLQYVTQKACGKRSASNRLVHLREALEPDRRQPIFTIELEALPHPPDVTIDLSVELQKADLILELMEIWEAKGQNSTERLELEQKAKDKSKRLEQVKREREMVEDELRKLKERRIILVEEERSGAEEMRVLSGRQAEAEEQQEQASKRWSHSRKRWDDLYYIDYDEDGYGLEGTDGGALLHLAAKNGYVEMVKLLLDKGADITVANNNRWTPLYAALSQGYVEVVKLASRQGGRRHSCNRWVDATYCGIS